MCVANSLGHDRLTFEGGHFGLITKKTDVGVDVFTRVSKATETKDDRIRYHDNTRAKMTTDEPRGDKI